jgi:vacuolar-type H+-ATPase subunit I/STV1
MDASGKLDRAKLQEALVELGSLDLPVNLLKEKKATILNLLEKFDAGASIDEVSNQFYAATNVTLEENKLDELELLKAKLLEVEAKLNEAINSVETEKTASAEKQASLSTLEETVSRLTEELKTANTELESLREFKAQLDTKAELGVKLDGIKAKFVEAGVERDNKYYAENAETLLKLDEAGISLLVKDVLLAAEASLTEDKVTKRIPALLNDDENYLGDPKELGRLLRERKAKK